jgi:hypothetical protein
MPALVLENLATLPVRVDSLLMLLTRLARTIDALVSAWATRAVPEWRMREVDREIARYNRIICIGKSGQR